MAFSTPTLKQIRARVRDDVTSRLPGADAAVGNSNLRVMSDANAGLALEEHAFLLWLARQLMPDTAEAEWLERFGNIYLRRGRKAGTFATGTITLSGTPGTIVPAGTALLYGNYVYETVDPVTIGASPTAADIEAVMAGATPSLEVGGSLRLQTAISGVNATAPVTSGEAGIDEESDDDLRVRVLDRIRKPPMGGDANDYVAWTLEVPGVTRAWPAPREMGIGTVTIRFMMDDLREDGFPLSGDLVTVADYLETVRPVTVKDLFVVAPIAEPINFTISGLVSDTAAVRASIAATVADMLARRAAPGQTIYFSWVSEAISSATGEDHHVLTFTDHAMPTIGHIAVPGVITYA
ncbi:MAG TPA: baseplate J/gp47 family protein [Kaistia sp.]|nr:baseplate J/gp47 family protein [Kaistia sp.]